MSRKNKTTSSKIEPTKASAIEPLPSARPALPKAKNNPTQFKRKMFKGLKNIYAEAQEESPDARISAPPSRRKTKILFGLLILFAFLATVSWAGFFFFGTGQKFSEEKIELKINGPEQSFAGQTITYRLSFNNRQKIPLANASLELRYPDNFKFISAKPAPTDKENRHWDLGSLNQNQSGLIEINGQIFGSANSDLTLRTFLNYKPANFNAEFQKIIHFATHLNPPPLDFTLTGPDELVAGEDAFYQINLLNVGDEPISNLEISLQTPSNFKINSLQPAPAKEQKIWRVASLEPNASSTIKIKGFFTAEILSSGSQTLSAKLNLREDDNLYQQNSLEKTTAVSQSALSLTVLANRLAEKQTVNFGDKIPFLLSFENIGQKSLKNVTLRIVLDAPFDGEKSLFDWAALEDKKDGSVKGEQISPAIRRGIISWTKAHIPALSEIKPKEQGTVEFLLPIKAKNELNLAKLTEYKIAAYGEALIGSTALEQLANLQSQTLTLVLNTDLNLSPQATFKEKKNLPTQIGQKYESETTYTLTWTLSNSWHEVTDVKLTTILPENADWKNVTAVSAGEISFNANTKEVVWQINRIPTSYPITTISFDVGVKASDSDKGKKGSIIDKTRVEAKDKVTGENMLFWKEAVMTIL